MGLNSLWCNGGAVFSCRIDTLINEAIEDESGFILGLTETPAVDKPAYATGIIRHGIRVDSVGGVYNGFKTFSIKIVMTSTGTNVVPTVKNMRAIALQI